jgi:dipeptidyl-peptidase-3
VSLANVVQAYHDSEIPAAKREFCWDDAEFERAERWGPLTEDLLTNLHEVIGHGSGRQGEECPGDPADRIREYFSSLEEARADLVALWFLADPVLRELGLLDDPAEGARAAYERYTRSGGLAQLRRAPHGNQLEEDHMRNRQLVVRWIEQHTRAIEWREREGKHYLVVADPAEWRAGAGRLLALVQELKSTGDYEGTKRLFDEYGIKFDPKLRDEVIERYRRLDVPAYTGFVMPRLQPVRDAAGAITDVRVSYPMDLEQQMLEWSGRREPPPPV